MPHFPLRVGRRAAWVFAALILPLGLVAEDPSAAGLDESAARQELKAAREKLERCRRMTAEHRARLAAAQGPAKVAETARDSAQAARDAADRALAALKNRRESPPAQTAQIDKSIELQERQIAESREQLRENPNDANARRTLDATEKFLARLRTRREQILKKAGAAPADLDAQIRQAEATAARATDAYWTAYGVWMKANSERELWQGAVARDEAEETLARQALQDLEADLLAKFRKSPLPHLERVVAEAGGKPIYDARWVSEEEVLDERIAFMRKAIADQIEQIRTQTGRRDEALTAYVDACHESIAAIHDYEEAIYSQARWTIAYELADAGISIALDFKDGGPPGALIGALIELGPHAYAAFSPGDISKRYELPASSREALPAPYHPYTFGEEMGKDAIKDAAKATVKGFVEGIGAGARDYRRLADAKPVIEELWVVMKRRVIFGNRVGSEAILVVMRKSTMEYTLRSLRDRVRGGLGAVKDGLKKEVLNPKLLKGMARSAAQSAIKTWLIESARTGRLAKWETFMEKEAVALALYREMRIQSNLLRFEKIQLLAYQEYLADLIAEREKESGRRRLRFDVETPPPPAAIQADDSLTLDLRLSFSRDIRDVVVNVNGSPAAGETRQTAWDGKAKVDSRAGAAHLTVEALDLLSKKPIDGQPFTVPRFLVTEERWADYEPGADNSHTIRLGPRKPGVSLVLLVDLSGSMNDNGRLARTKAAAADALKPGALGPDDEVALWTFQDTAASLVHPFTPDAARLLASVHGMTADGSTPLALAIYRAGDYAHSAGRNHRKVLLVLSDGEETNGGDPFEAMQSVRKRGVETREGMK